MLEEFGEISEEIEEVRELLYNLLKDFPAGVTSTFLEEQYEERYVRTGIASYSLPKDWLRHIKMADEFEVKQLPTFTMIYIVNHLPAEDNFGASDEALISETQNGTNALEFLEKVHEVNKNEANGESENSEDAISGSKLEPMGLSSLPKIGETTKVMVVSVMDPENIFIRLCAWDPVPDYLYSALSRIPFQSDLELPDTSEITPGEIFAARIHNTWQRVFVIRQSDNNTNYWVVFVIDMGFFHLVHAKDLRLLSREVEAFKKVFLAKCKIFGIKPTNQDIIDPPSSQQWSRSAQQAISDLLRCGNPVIENVYQTSANIELVPMAEWTYSKDTPLGRIPFVSGYLKVNGEDIGEKFVTMGFAC
ncbi:tudor domain-containing protein [Ditylenchus destructor]|uniref:Tudor domain-containing protein n=1 Tax=Ditylenchus destructor TaxID=166010 RepID=A0AAD4R8F8_9BILA|nr:tudor domain-containing protein [Ditylenchus destructor]